MATLNASLSLTASNVSSSPLALTLTSGLTVSSPSIGISRQTATVVAPVTLVPATEGTKYCFVQHTGYRPDGVTASTNTMTVSTVSEAPTAQITTIVFNLEFVAGDVVTLTINGVAQESIEFNTDSGVTANLVSQQLVQHAAVLTAQVTNGPTTHSYAIVGAFPGETFTVTAVHAHSAGNPTTTSDTTVAATGASHTRLRAGEFMFVPVKAGEGLQVLAQGTDTITEPIQLEYAYWTKSVE